MNLFDFYYVSNASEDIKIKEKQKSIQAAFEKLSVASKKEQQRQQQRKPQHKDKNRISNLYQYLIDSNDHHLRPYDPIIDHCLSQNTNSLLSSLNDRTPSMLSYASYSSNFSSSTLSTIPDENCYPGSQNFSISNYTLTERDEYGFKRPIWIKPTRIAEFEQKYIKSREKQSKSWNKLLESTNNQWPDVCPQLYNFAQKGIPSDIRPKAWFHYSGAEEKLKSNKGKYQKLLETKEENTEHIESIKKDLCRTFPDNVFFYNENYQYTKIHSLRRVLTAFSYYSPDIGYCQSLNFLAAFLLLILDNEEQAFWLLVTIVHDYFPKGMFDTTMEGVLIEQSVFMMMVYEKFPAIWTKIANKQCFWECENQDNLPPITLLTSHWFLTSFVNILPTETVLRIWDCIFVGEGFKVLYQVALTIVKLNESRILNAEDGVEAFQILQSMPKQIIDCDEFIKCIFSVNNDISSGISTLEIESKRQLFKNRKCS